MTRNMVVAAGILACFASCTKPAPDLLGEAHAAAQVLLDEKAGAEFDDGFAQVFPEDGLVCGGQVNIRNGFGGYAGFQRYYFSRAQGIALEGDESAPWQSLADACIAAILQRIETIDRKLEAGGADAAT